MSKKHPTKPIVHRLCLRRDFYAVIDSETYEKVKNDRQFKVDYILALLQEYLERNSDIIEVL